jgi:hypothetical protein
VWEREKRLLTWFFCDITVFFYIYHSLFFNSIDVAIFDFELTANECDAIRTLLSSPENP